MLDADEDVVDGVNIDVTATDVPAYDDKGTSATDDDSGGITAFQYELQYSAANLTIADHEYDTQGVHLLLRNPRSVLTDQGDPTPDDNYDDFWYANIVDWPSYGQIPTSIPEDGSGVLGRLTLITEPLAVSGVYPVTIYPENDGYYDASGHAHDAQLIENAFVAVNTHCPSSGTPPATTYTVDSTEDGGDTAPGDGICAVVQGRTCTLRAAIEEANAWIGKDTIAFNLDGPRRIVPTSALPLLNDPVVIDGTTQRGYRGKPLIELDGSLAGPATGLVLAGGHSVVKGLVVNRFSGGIWIRSDSNRLQGNFIGTDASGRRDAGNRGTGVYLSDGVGNSIGGKEPSERNVISGNDNYGIEVLRSGNRIQGNFIGTDVSGERSVGNSFNGVLIFGGLGDCSASLTLIGGAEPGAGNLISGNGTRGILNERGCTRVQGNKIGTNVTGRRPLGNGAEGVGVLSHVEARENIIAYNGGYGITGEGVASLRNSIHSNGDLGLNGFTDLAAPSLEGASRTRGRLAVNGSAHVTAPAAVPANVEIEVFANEACDPSGFGEGQRPLGSVILTTDSAGDASFSITVDAPAGRFQYVTATLTTTSYPAGLPETSKFSNCLLVSR